MLMLLFHAGNDLFAIDANYISEIYPLKTTEPKINPDESVYFVDMTEVLTAHARDPSRLARLVYLRNAPLALIVEKATEMLEWRDLAQLQQDSSKPYLKGFILDKDRKIHLVDVETLVKDFKSKSKPAALPVKRPQEVEPDLSLIIFRLDKSWFGLNAKSFAEVLFRKTIHHLPHFSRSHQTVLGLINFRGRLTLTVALNKLLGVKINDNISHMLSIEEERGFWVFPVDEVFGVQRCYSSRLQTFRPDEKNSSVNCIKNILDWEGKKVAVIDEDLLFYHLRRSLK